MFISLNFICLLPLILGKENFFQNYENIFKNKNETFQNFENIVKLINFDIYQTLMIIDNEGIKNAFFFH